MKRNKVSHSLKQKTKTVNGYFATANYLDSAIKDFFDYLKETGLYDNSIIVMYGDHYGISDTRSSNLAELLGKNPEIGQTMIRPCFNVFLT